MTDQQMCALETLLDRVCDEPSFIRFLRALSTDWEDEQRKEVIRPSPPYGPGANGWENGTIGTFLDAAAGCGEDWLDLDDPDRADQNPWHRAAQLIYAGKHYE